MAGRLFSSGYRARLLQNGNVVSAIEKRISYSPDFEIRAVRANAEGKLPYIIFLDAGLDPDVIGHQTPKRCLERWRRVFEQRGEQGLLDDQRGKGSSGRPLERELTVEERLRRAEARIKYIELENDFLKKLDALERAWLASHPKSTR